MSRAFVRSVREYESLASTSDTARQLVEDGGIELPLMVLARNQTAGRGRGENRWWSDAGSLTFSLAFDPASLGLAREQESRIALATAVAIVRACGPIAPLGIRWPNDVECRGKKLGGLLPERIETPAGPRFILGIGLNVTTDLGHAPDAVRMMASSLAEQGACQPDKEIVLAAVLDRIGEALAQLADNDPGLPRAWGDLDTLLGREVRLKFGDAIIEGIGAGIGIDGSLILRNGSGDHIFHAGQVLRDLKSSKPT